MNVMFNFTNNVDEVMTQRELEKSPAGQDFINKWTWPLKEPEQGKKPRFKRTNTIEEYFYVRIIEEDVPLGIGALRIHWDGDGDFILDTTMDIQLISQDFNCRIDPRKKHDVIGVIKAKLYNHLHVRLATGRYGRSQFLPQPAIRNPNFEHQERPCDHHDLPYYRGFDDRGLDYKNHGYCPRPGDVKPNRPKNGPYGGVYNAFDEIEHTNERHCHL